MSLYKKIVRTLNVTNTLSQVEMLRKRTQGTISCNKVQDLGIEEGLLLVDTILASLEAKLSAEQDSNAFTKHQVAEGLAYLTKELGEYNKQMERELSVKYTQAIE